MLGQKRRYSISAVLKFEKNAQKSPVVNLSASTRQPLVVPFVIFCPTAVWMGDVDVYGPWRKTKRAKGASERPTTISAMRYALGHCTTVRRMLKENAAYDTRD